MADRLEQAQTVDGLEQRGGECGRGGAGGFDAWTRAADLPSGDGTKGWRSFWLRVDSSRDVRDGESRERN